MFVVLRANNVCIILCVILKTMSRRNGISLLNQLNGKNKSQYIMQFANDILKFIILDGNGGIYL